MTFLPIVDRELRARARWRSTYLVRTGVAVLAFAVTLVLSFSMIFGGPAAAGKHMLVTLAWITFAFCVVEGFRSTADCISEEKREGTLGLLFLTDLRGYDVVLGKLAATSLSSVYGLLAAIPAFAVPVLLGGVAGLEFWRVVLVLIVTLWFSLTAGVFVSTVSRDERRAWSGTALFVIIPVLLFPIVDGVAGRQILGWFSPTTPMLNAFDAEYRTAPQLFWRPLGVTSAIGLVLLFAGSFLLPRVWQDEPARRSSRRVKPADAVTRGRLLRINPVWWLTSRHDEHRRWLWVLVIAVVALMVAIWGWNEGSSEAGLGVYGIAVFAHFVVSIWVASEACYSFADARSSGAMELLLSTPLSVRQIVRGQQLAIRALFIKPIVFLLSIEVGLLICHIALASTKQQGMFEPIFAFIVGGFTIAWFLLDLYAVSRVGMWFSLTSAKPTHALSKTVFFVLVLPLVFLPCCQMVAPGMMLAKSFIFFTWAQGKLDNEFRKAATQRFEGARPGLWSKAQPPRLTFPS